MLLNTESTYQSLQSFSSIEDMNKSVKHYKQVYKSKMTKSTYEILDALSQYSCVYFGVSYISQRKLAEQLDISYKTVQRGINSLVELGIIKKYETKRVTGDKRQSTNIFVIIPMNDQPEMSNQETPIQNSKSINTYDTKIEFDRESKESLIKKGLVSKLPSTLKRVLAPFFDADKLYQLSGIVFKAKSSVDKSIQLEEHESDYYNAILSVLNAFKRGKVTNLEGLLYHAIKTTTRSIWLKQRAKVAFGI